MSGMLVRNVAWLLSVTVDLHLNPTRQQCGVSFFLVALQDLKSPVIIIIIAACLMIIDLCGGGGEFCAVLLW